MLARGAGLRARTGPGAARCGGGTCPRGSAYGPATPWVTPRTMARARMRMSRAVPSATPWRAAGRVKEQNSRKRRGLERWLSSAVPHAMEEKLGPGTHEAKFRKALARTQELDEAQLREITRETGLSKESLLKFRVGVDFNFRDQCILCFPYYGVPTMFNDLGRDMKRRFENATFDTPFLDTENLLAVTEVHLGAKGAVRKKISTVPHGHAFDSLFGWQIISQGGLDSMDEVLLTTTEEEAILLHQETGIPALALTWNPDGGEHGEERMCRILRPLSGFKAVRVWASPDQAGRSGRPLTERLTKLVVKAVGRDKVELVKPANEADAGPLRMHLMHRAGKLKETLAEAAVQTSPGKELRNPSVIPKAVMFDSGMDLINNPPSEGTPFQSFPGLTKILKGHRSGELTVLTGATGSGKTTFLANMTVDLARQGVRHLWASFEIKPANLVLTMTKQMAGLTDGSGTYVTAEANMVQADSQGVASPAPRSHQAGYGPETLTTALNELCKLDIEVADYHGSTEVGVLIDLMMDSHIMQDTDHFIVDNLQFMLSEVTADGRQRYGNPMEKITQMEHAIGEFRRFVTLTGKHVTVVIHPRKEPEGAALTMASFSGSGKATQEADNVIILQKLGQGESTQKFIEVKKNRFDGTTGMVPVTFDWRSRRFLEQQQEADSV